MSVIDLKSSVVGRESRVDKEEGRDERDDRNYAELISGIKGTEGVRMHNKDDNYTVRKDEDHRRKMSIPSEESEKRELSTRLQEMINNNSELGSRLLSLLLVNSENAKSIIEAVNKGDFSDFDRLEVRQDGKDGADITEEGKKGSALEEKVSEAKEDLEDVRKREEEKRRRNTEASARFRVRKKEKEKERLKQFELLIEDIGGMYDKIDGLVEENNYWKRRLEELNELRSRQLLDSIKRRSGIRKER